MTMKKKIVLSLLGLLSSLLLYLLFWPVPITPVAWQAPPDPGYTGVFARNARLQGIALLPLGGDHGPEEVVVDARGCLYASTREGYILRLEPNGSPPQPWVDTGGSPLGIVFDRQGNLIVADAVRGLLEITPEGRLLELATEADGVAIHYANNADVAADGKIYFTDSSDKFSPQAFGGTYPASLLDILEHSGRGRLLVYDPATAQARTLLRGLNFPNGVAVSSDQTYVLVNETGAYRVLRYWIGGSRSGQAETFIAQLPGFPDNLTRGQDGRYWVALISPRSALLDKLSDKPFWRRVIPRLPAFLRPRAVPYGHVIALNAEGEVMLDLQDPDGLYPLTTSVTETSDYLYLGSLSAPAVGRLAKVQLGL
jgi:sugar lactone lactonase YvrE